MPQTPDDLNKLSTTFALSVEPKDLIIDRPGSSVTDSTFICTICWHPQYPSSASSDCPSSTRPRLLGTSARIVCQPCWRAVLDLSICWVCGECIIRGDDVVSLGWCFWHRGCFGCLICGTKLRIPDLDEDCMGDCGQLKKCTRAKYDTGGRKTAETTAGVELNEIPLCEVCEVETIGERQIDVLEKGLDNVSRFDGGLSRDRLNMLSEDNNDMVKEAPRRLVRSPRRLRGATCLESELKRYINGTSHGSKDLNLSDIIVTEEHYPLLSDAGTMGISEDGATEAQEANSPRSWSCDSSIYPQKSTLPNDVYVSVFDPLGEPVFKPNSTKPLPRWMTLLPNNFKGNHDQKSARVSQSQNSIPSIKTTEVQPIAVETLRAHTDSTATARIPVKVLDSETCSPPIDIPRTNKRTRTISVEDDELERYNARAFRRSQTIESIYATPPEYPSWNLPRREPTPFPKSHRPVLRKNEVSSYFSGNHSSSTPVSLEEPTSVARSRPTLQEPCPIASTGGLKESEQWLLRPHLPKQQSSEYLDRYRPKPLHVPHKPYLIKEPGSIIDKIKGQKRGTQGSKSEAEEKHHKVRGLQQEYEERGKGIAEGCQNAYEPKMQNLQKELKSLFSAS